MNTQDCLNAQQAWPDQTPTLSQDYYAALACETGKFVHECQCLAGQTPTLVNIGKVITGLMKIHFADPHNFGALSEYMTGLVLDMPGYDDPQNRANLKVYLNGTAQPDYDSFTNLVVVDVMGAQDDKKVLGNFGGYSPDYSARQSVNMRSVVVRINCFADSTDLACQMAGSASDAMKMFREDVLQRVLNIAGMEVESITPNKKSSASGSDSKARWTVSVRLSVPSYLYVTTEGHRLKSFVTTFIPKPGQLDI